jgi:uncharacterized protein YyaL (SSP411 family)
MSTELSTNRLINEKSPYLLQHAHNPVDWFPWGEEAFAKARAENKPIFLSVGYSTCHWCHVMEHESFENPEIASILNRHFVSIKVDREERPDVDRVYMLFVQSTTGSGGWPMSVFLTPQLQPFLGGTYYPPEDRYGRPGFGTLLERLAGIWREHEGKVLDQGEQFTTALNEALTKKVSQPTESMQSEWLWASTEISASGSVYFSVPILGADPFRRCVGHGSFHFAENGGGRDVRPSWGRLSPLLGR